MQMEYEPTPTCLPSDRHEPLNAAGLNEDVLREIFFHTIPPSYLMDTSLVGGDNSPWCQSLRTKKALTLVCKSWYSAAIGFLYGDVSIRRIGQLSSLLRTLQDASAPKYLGALVFTLQISCYVPEPDIFLKGLQGVLEACPFITSFYIDAFEEPHAHGLDDSTLLLTEYLQETIKHISFGTQLYFPSVIPRLAPCAQHIQSLTFSGIEEGIISGSNLSFPNLTHLYYKYPWSQERGKRLSMPSYIADTWALPKLKFLSIYASKYVTYPLEDWLPFFRRFGSQLLHLSILCDFERIANVSHLKSLLEHCTLLEHLVIPFVEQLDFTSPTLQYLDVFRVPLHLDDSEDNSQSDVDIDPELEPFCLPRPMPISFCPDVLPRLCRVRDIFTNQADIPFIISPAIDVRGDLHYPGIRMIICDNAIYKLVPRYHFPAEVDTDDDEEGSESEMEVDWWGSSASDDDTPNLSWLYKCRDDLYEDGDSEYWSGDESEMDILEHCDNNATAQTQTQAPSKASAQ